MMTGRAVPTYDIYEFHPRKTRYAVLIPVIDEGERILNQLRRMDFLRGHADIVIGDGGSKDTTGDPNVLKNFAVRALLVKTSAGKQSAQLRMLLDYAIYQGYEGRQYPDHEPEPARHAIRHAADPTTTELFA